MDLSGFGDDDVGVVFHTKTRNTPLPEMRSGAPVAHATIDDEQWAAFEKWKTAQERKAAKSAGGVKLPDFVNIQVEAVENMAPNGHPVGVNGTCFIIKAGVPQKVPGYIVEVLRNAKIGTPVRDPVTGKVLRYEDRLRLPFTILPEDEDFEADAA